MRASRRSAIVFISTAVDQVSEVADRVAAMPEVTEVYSVTGDVDLIAIVRTREIERIADAVSTVDAHTFLAAALN